MATTFSVEETIPRPVAEVWAALTDWPRAPRWMRGIERMAADGETKQGTVLTFFTRRAERTTIIAECEPERLIVLRSVQSGVTADYTYRLEAVSEEQTRITLVAECDFAGVWSLLAPLLRWVIRRTDGSQLQFLRQVVEES